MTTHLRLAGVSSLILILVIILAVSRIHRTPAVSPSQSKQPVIMVSTSTALLENYTVDSKYVYQALGPTKTIYGIKFTIPTAMATGTNLSVDSYISVEEIPKTAECGATLFTEKGIKPMEVVDSGVTYSVASSSDAGAGNRYDEIVYAIPGTNPCIAVRYFIHYGAFQNYPEGMVKEFDRAAIIKEFDQIRRTLVISQ